MRVEKHLSGCNWMLVSLKNQWVKLVFKSVAADFEFAELLLAQIADSLILKILLFDSQGKKKRKANIWVLKNCS